MTPLDARLLEELDGGREVWMLLSPLVYYSVVLGRVLAVSSGFVSDGESRPMLGLALTGPPCRKAGIVHDWLTATHLCSFEDATAVYREALLVGGLHEVWADQRVGAVDFYGRGYWESGPARLRVWSPFASGLLRPSAMLATA